MDRATLHEEENLRLSWDRRPAKYLDRYLVSGVQDPRINGQSILTRAWLVDTLCPGRFDGVITEELRFGAVLTWISQQLEGGSTRCELLDRIESACRAHVPDFVLAAHAWLQGTDCPVDDYIAGALVDHDLDIPRCCLPDSTLDKFMTIWNEQLPDMPAASLSVLEAACGSANDYRFISRCGLARFLDYTGIDIAPRNIANARSRHPDANVLVRSILTTDFADDSYDSLFCHDLLEHLSPGAMERALAEMFRIARRDMIFHFFNGKWSGDHEVIPVGSYHRNRLSMEEIAAFLERLGARVTCLEMAQWLRERIDGPGYHNPNAFSLIAEKTLGLAK
jgi:SAM-dependent methyltransferase